MGRPAKPGERRYVRLPEQMWKQITELSDVYGTDHSEVIEAAFHFGVQHPDFHARLSQDATTTLWEMIIALPHLDTFRAIDAADGMHDTRKSFTHGEIVVSQNSQRAWAHWNSLREILKMSFDRWLLERLYPAASNLLREAAQAGDITIDKNVNRWTFRILRASKKLTAEVNRLMQDGVVHARNDNDVWQYQFLF